MGRGLGDLIASLIIGAIGYVVADTVTKEHTGKHIHEHLYEWYRRAHDAVTQWAHSQGDLKAVRILVAVDQAVTGLKNRVDMAFAGTSQRHTSPVVIWEASIPLEEARRQLGTQICPGKVYDATQAMLG